MVRHLQNIFMEHDLYLMDNWIILTPIVGYCYKYPVQIETGFVVQGHILASWYNFINLFFLLRL